MPHRIFSPLLALSLILLLVIAVLPAQAAPLAPPAAPLVDQIIVGFEPGSAAAVQAARGPAQAAAQLSAVVDRELDYVRPLAGGAHVLRLPAPLPPEEAAALAARLAADAGVAYAEPDLTFFPAQAPNDPLFAPSLWNLQAVGATTYGANLPDAWMITTGDPAIVTAILDTGGLLGHEDLADRTPPGNPGYDFISAASNANDGDGRDPDPGDPGDWVTTSTPGCPAAPSSWHGSHVAGIFGARANNARGIVGVNWDSPLLFVRVLGRCGGSLTDIAEAMRWAAGLPVPGIPTNPTPARILNLSLGAGATYCPTTLRDAITAVNASGAIVVVAAGNAGVLASNATPANCEGVVVVAATGRAGNRAAYSNYGPLVSLAAPGGDSSAAVISTVNSGTTVPTPAGDSYTGYSGTSMATPHVAGAISLMLSVNPGLSRNEVLAILRDTVTPFPPGSGCGGICGPGIVNAGAAVEAVARQVRNLSFADGPLLVSENSTATIPLELSIASNQVVSVPYTVAGTASPADHTLRSGTLNFVPGERRADLSVSVVADSEGDPGETISITLGEVTGATLVGPATRTLIIQDATGPALLVLDTTALSFGTQPVGTTGSIQTVVVANAGGEPMQLTGVSLEGEFVRAGGTCPAAYPASLAPGASCTLAIAFTPTGLGSRVGQLTVTDGGGEPRTVALSGAGAVRVALPLLRR